MDEILFGQEHASTLVVGWMKIGEWGCPFQRHLFSIALEF